MGKYLEILGANFSANSLKSVQFAANSFVPADARRGYIISTASVGGQIVTHITPNDGSVVTNYIPLPSTAKRMYFTGLDFSALVRWRATAAEDDNENCIEGHYGPLTPTFPETDYDGSIELGGLYDDGMRYIVLNIYRGGSGTAAGADVSDIWVWFGE